MADPIETQIKNVRRRRDELTAQRDSLRVQLAQLDNVINECTEVLKELEQFKSETHEPLNAFAGIKP